MSAVMERLTLLCLGAAVLCLYTAGAALFAFPLIGSWRLPASFARGAAAAFVAALLADWLSEQA